MKLFRSTYHVAALNIFSDYVMEGVYNKQEPSKQRRCAEEGRKFESSKDFIKFKRSKLKKQEESK